MKKELVCTKMVTHSHNPPLSLTVTPETVLRFGLRLFPQSYSITLRYEALNITAHFTRLNLQPYLKMLLWIKLC